LEITNAEHRSGKRSRFACYNDHPVPRPADERFQPIFIKPASAVVGDAEHSALRVAVRLLAMDHDARVAIATANDSEAQQAVRWMALSCDLAASRLLILIELLAEARHRLAIVQEVSRG
jgi:hypothetical protein